MDAYSMGPESVRTVRFQGVSALVTKSNPTIRYTGLPGTTGEAGTTSPALPMLSVAAKDGPWVLDLRPVTPQIDSGAPTRSLSTRAGLDELQAGLVKGQWSP
jgi:hypothetical protein